MILSITDGLLLPTMAENTPAYVAVTDGNNAPITNATVVVNGQTLNYDADTQRYTGLLRNEPGGSVSVSVTVAGVTYTGTQQFFESFPTIYTFPKVEAPTNTAVWSTQMANRIEWGGVVPRARSSYQVGVLDPETGTLLWPAGRALQTVAYTEHSVTVPGSTLTAGTRLIVVGIVDVAEIPGARQGSGLIVGAFNSRRVSVSTFQPKPTPTPATSQAVGFHIDPAHAGHATLATGQPVFPTTSTWTTTLNNKVSYPVIAEGKVFVLTDGVLETGTGRSLYALNETDGSIAWGPITLPFSSFSYAAHAYDHGRIFTIDFDGRLTAYNAANGAIVWSETLQETGFFSSAPTALNGLVYVGGPQGELYAIDQDTGAIVWKAITPDRGTVSSPTVSADGVFVVAPCHASKFDPLTGNLLWHNDGPYSGGGAGVPGVFANNQLHFTDRCMSSPGTGRVLDAQTGSQTGTFFGDRLPAFSDQVGYYLQTPTLMAVDLASNTTLWSFPNASDPFTTAPIVVGDYAIAGTSSGKVYAFGPTSSAAVWTAMAPSPIEHKEEGGSPTVPGGNAVGDGYLVVPAGNTLTAWRLVP
ncbi:MAG: PQQ-like beta-propeller repeat protein [Steroidobacteraceae bacterium]|nr:PQQ-like beta-propeller repeat protein [Steroidobacteraceae bacterium]